MKKRKTVIVLPTYQEKENIFKLLESIFEQQILLNVGGIYGGRLPMIMYPVVILTCLFTFLVVDQYMVHILYTNPVCTEMKRLKTSGIAWNIERYNKIKDVIDCE